MNATRVPVLIIAAALALVLPGARPADAAPTVFRVYQLNMCMTGSPHYVKNNAKNGQTGADTCFPNPYVSKDSNGKLHYASGYEAREKTIAAVKRQDLIDQIATNLPSAVTLNEVCKGDLATIVKTLRTLGLSYTYKSQGVGRGSGSGPRTCSVGRGDSVDGIIAHGFVSGSKQSGYYEANGYRSYLCARVTPALQLPPGNVRVCTSHLSVASLGTHQAYECSKLRRILGSTSSATVFGGDVNIKKAKRNCMPTGWWGLRDLELVTALSIPNSSLQHIYYTPDFTRGPTCGTIHPVLTSDHRGFLLTLLGTSSRRQGLPCTTRDVRK